MLPLSGPVALLWRAVAAGPARCLRGRRLWRLRSGGLVEVTKPRCGRVLASRGQVCRHLVQGHAPAFAAAAAAEPPQLADDAVLEPGDVQQAQRSRDQE